MSKNTCSPSYADYTPKTNEVILLEMGPHTKEILCMSRIWKGKETKDVNVLNMLTV
jgi:hypothetical protein